MKHADNDKISAELADKLSSLDSPEKERDEIRARVAEVRARFEAKKKKAAQKTS